MEKVKKLPHLLPFERPFEGEIGFQPLHPFTFYITNASNADTIMVQCSYGDSIENLMRIIEQKLLVPKDDQILVFSGETLDRGKLLMHCNVPLECQLYLLDRKVTEEQAKLAEEELEEMKKLQPPPPPKPDPKAKGKAKAKAKKK